MARRSAGQRKEKPVVKKIREQDESERVAGEPERGSEGVIDVPSGSEDEKKAASPEPSGS